MDFALRPYASAFASRFQLMLQYRAAALAGFVTQCWFGGVKVMIYAAFYANAAGATAPISLSQTITYTWIVQALLAILPWFPDPDVVAGVRSGAVAYDRLRPVDAYAFWYARSLAWMAARALPRATLMLAFAGLALPLMGLSRWGWGPPASLQAGLLFAVSVPLALALSASLLMMVHLVIAATLNDRGINIVIMPVVVVLTGMLLPLSLFPDAIQTALLLQPLAGVMDLPIRIYTGVLTGPGAALALALQAGWAIVLAVLGRAWMERVMRRLEVQGG